MNTPLPLDDVRLGHRRIMPRAIRLGAFASLLLLLNGCTHSVRVEAVRDGGNHLVVTEKMRPWPVTLIHRIKITLPPGDYPYEPHSYEVQTSLPKKPVRILKHSEIGFFIREHHDAEILDGGWIAIFPDGVELQLLWNGSPASINGRYSTKVPFVRSSP